MVQPTFRFKAPDLSPLEDDSSLVPNTDVTT